MFLSNRDIQWAITCGKLIVDPPPEHFSAGYDETSIDLHLDSIKDGARVWDIERYKASVTGRGVRGHAEIQMGSFRWESIAGDFLIPISERTPAQASGEDNGPLIFRRSDEVVVRPFGFLLWTTKEQVGTPKIDPLDGPDAIKSRRHPELICFVNAKSTRARTGILVHFTAPTIHAGWAGKITLEITNLGPFDFVLRENDAIAQLTVATISSAPDLTLRQNEQQTQGQTDPSGKPGKKGKPTSAKKAR